jgi:phosphoserine phosphatase
MIKAIVFDFEGPIWTLGDRTVFNEASKEKGLKEDVFSKLARQYFDGAHVGEFADYDDFYKKVNPKTELSLEDFKEAIEQYDNTRQYQSEVIKLIEQLT